MFRNLARLYSRRIVNVNVNILLAGILALGPAVLAVRLTYMWLGVSDPNMLTHPQKLIITGVTFVTDITFDVTIYYCLHWLANHLPRRLKMAEGVLDAAHVPFMKDASVVQLQRAIISPVLYIGWLGTQYMLLGRIDAWLATVVGWCIGITAARTLHTIWMIRAQKWARRKLTAAMQAVVPPSNPDPPPAPGTPPSGSPPPR